MGAVALVPVRAGVSRRNIRTAQDRNALISSRLGAQLEQRTVRGRRKRFFGGPLLLPALNVASPNALAATRLLSQQRTVAKELSLANLVAGPGPIQ